MTERHLPANRPPDDLTFDPKAATPLMMRGLMRLEGLEAEEPLLPTERLLQLLESGSLGVFMDLDLEPHWLTAHHVVPLAYRHFKGPEGVAPALYWYKGISMRLEEALDLAEHFVVAHRDLGTVLAFGFVGGFESSRGVMFGAEPMRSSGIGAVGWFDPDRTHPDLTHACAWTYPVLAATRGDAVDPAGIGLGALRVLLRRGALWDEPPLWEVRLVDATFGGRRYAGRSGAFPVRWSSTRVGTGMNELIAYPHTICLSTEDPATIVCAGYIGGRVDYDEEGLAFFSLQECNGSGITGVGWLRRMAEDETNVNVMAVSPKPYYTSNPKH